MTAGPSYGQGYVDLSPRLERDALASINRQLERTFSDIRLDIDEQPLRAIESRLQSVEQAADDTASSVSRIADRSEDVEARFRNLAGHLDISEDEARRLANEIIQSQRNAALLEESALKTARALGLSEAEAKDFARELRRADTAAESIDTHTGRLTGRLRDLRTTAGTLAGAFAVVGGTQLLGNALRGANEAIQAFAELQDSANAVTVTFETADRTIFDFGETVAQSAGLSRQAFQQLVVPIGSLLRNFGFDAQEAADASVQLVQRGADLASVYGGDVTEALTAVGAALRGEADPLERFGASISAARVEAFALSEGLAATKGEITDAVRVQARLGLILADTARVQGDFANTSGDLANAQRSAAAEAANFAAEVGEALAPSLEALVDVLPQVLEGARQLVPAFAAGADSAAEFFKAMGEGGGMRREFAALGAGVELVTSGAGLATDAVQSLASAFSGDLAGAFAQIRQGGRQIERSFAGLIPVELANDLDRGVEAVEAFRIAIESTAAGSSDLELFTDNYQAFAIAANLSAPELRDVTEELIRNAREIGLTADEVDFLETKFALLRNTLQPVGNEVNQARRTMEEFGEATQGAAGPFGNFVDTVVTEAARLGTFTGQLQAATADVAESLDPFKAADERIKVSARQFFKNLVAQVNQQAIFQANIAKLIGLEFDDIAREIAEAGPGANQAAEQFLANLDLAERAEALLEGQGTAIANQVGSELAEQLTSTQLTVQQQRAFVELMDAGIFSNSQVQRAIQSGTLGTAQDIAAGVANAFGGIDFNIEIDLTEEGREARGTFIAGLSQIQPGEITKVRNSILDTYDAAVNRSSPPKLFSDLGEEAIATYWSGFESGVMDFPSIEFAKAIPSGILEVTADDGAGGNQFNVTVNNPIGEPSEDSLQAALIEVAVSPTVNRLVSAGSSR